MAERNLAAINRMHNSNPFGAPNRTNEVDKSSVDLLSVSAQLFSDALQAIHRWHESYLTAISSAPYSNLPVQNSADTLPAQNKNQPANPCTSILQRLTAQMDQVGMPEQLRKGWEEALVGCLAQRKITQTQYDDAIELINSGGVVVGRST